MELKSDLLKKVIDAINSNGPLVCPMCRQTKGFSFDPNGSQILALNTIENLLTTRVVDQLPAITGCCKHCGYVIQYSLQHLGVNYE